MYKWSLFFISLTGLSLYACSDQPVPGMDDTSGTNSTLSSGSSSQESGNTGDGMATASESDTIDGTSDQQTASDTSTSGVPIAVCPGPDIFEPNDEASAAAA